MFMQKIDETAFTTRRANDFFGDSVKEYSRGVDASFVSTLRALLHERVGADDRIMIRYSSSRFTSGEMSGVSTSRLVHYMLSTDPNNRRNTIFVHSINGDAPDRNDCLKRMREKFTAAFESFERVQKVTDFFRKSFPVLCFIDKSSQNVVLIIDKMTMRKFHAIQAATFAFLPWYFEPMVVSEDEMALIRSLQEKTPDAYLAVIDKIFNGIDIRSTLIKRQLKGFESRCDKIQMESVEREITEANEYIDEWIRAIAEKTSFLDQKMMQYNTLKERTENSQDEIMEYFLRNKSIDLIRVEGDSVWFHSRGQLIYFDEENAARCISRSNSFMYEYLGDSCFSFDDYKALLTAIFIDQTLKVNVVGTFRLACNGSIEAAEGLDYGSEYKHYTPNPHLYHYGCLGNNRAAIAQFIRDGNLIGAIEQCCAATCSLNFGDGAVMPRLMRTLCRTDGLNNRCIQTPDEQVLTPAEAIDWLKNNNSTEVNENE